MHLDTGLIELIGYIALEVSTCGETQGEMHGQRELHVGADPVVKRTGISRNPVYVKPQVLPVNADRIERYVFKIEQGWLDTGTDPVMNEVPRPLIANSCVVGKIRLPGIKPIVIIEGYTGYHAFSSPDTPADDLAGEQSAI